MQYKKIVMQFCVLMSSLLLLAAVQAKTTEQSLDRIVATVNDSVITQSELDDAMQRITSQLKANHTPLPSQDVIQKRVLDQLVDRKLQLLLAEQAGIKINDDEMNKVISGIAEQNKISTDELYKKLRSEGMSEESYQKEIRDELVLQRVQQQQVGSHIVITPQEIDDFLRSATWRAYNNKEYHLEDILIALPEAPSPQDVADAKKQAANVLTKIHKGISFREVAMAESGSTHALQGGDMGWLKLPQIPPAFANKLVHMKADDILGPVATPNGFHIVRLVAVRDIGGSTNGVEQRKQVQELLYQRKLDEGIQAWMTKMRSEAFINLNPEAHSG